MSSSPDAVPAALTWEPGDLTTGERSAPPAHELRLFEVASRAAVPDDLLAEARSAARAQGWSAGWAEGMRAAATRAAALAETQRAEHAQLIGRQHADVQRAVSALDRAAMELEGRIAPTVGEVESLLLESSFAIAEALVGHALRDDETRAPSALARVLALAPAGEPVTVRMNPADHTRLIAADWAADRAERSARPITLVADATLAPGDAVATAGATEIDARIRAGVERVREVLAP